MNRRKSLVCLLVLALWTLAACGGPGPVGEPTAEPSTAEPPSSAVETESSRDGVFTVAADGQRQSLPSPRQTFLRVGEGVDVDADGRAILRFADLLTVEVLRDSELVLQELSADEQSAFVTVLQNGGALINDFNPQQEINRRFTVRTEFAVITAVGTRFMVVREADTPLEWVVGLDADEGHLEVTADGVTKPMTTGIARWIAPFGEPSAGITYLEEDVNEWIGSVVGGVPQPEIGEVLWPHADTLTNTQPLAELPQPGQAFDLEGGVKGAVRLTLDPKGLFGSPAYWLEDCNGDGIQDIAMQAGKLLMDFRPVLSRVRALDVTVMNHGQPGSGSLLVLDPRRNDMNRELLTAGPGEGQILSLRSNPGQPYHYAELAMTNGCFLGFSLTPPRRDGEPGDPRPAVELVTPTATPTPAPLCTVVARGLNLRYGPGAVYDPPIGVLPNGAHLEPLARSPDGRWIQVPVGRDVGWVSAGPSFVSCNIDVATLPIGVVPPTPTPTPTPAFTPTPTRTPTPTPTPTPAYTPPKLSEPPNESTVYKLPLTLKWIWNGTLGANEYFDIRVWFGGQAKSRIGLSRELAFTIGPEHPIWRFGPGWYHWQIVVVEARGGRVVRELSPPSREWAFQWVREQADLTVRSIDAPYVDCSYSVCTTTVTVTIANVGRAAAGPFKVLIKGDPALQQQTTVGIDGLAAGETRTITQALPAGGNCYDPDCTVCVVVDSGGHVDESNEQNNEECTTIIG
ncbi:MAG: CARDB domain-containing protein [Anaerolineae bacterium]